MNKKGFTKLMIVITVFGVAALIMMFGTIFVKEAGDQYLGEPIKDIGLEILNNSKAPANFTTTVNNVDETYDDINIPYDILFLIFWILWTGSVFSMAYKVRKLGLYHWIGMVFIGSMFFLLILGFVAQFTDWFIENFYNVLFSDINLNTPIMDFYFEYMALINYITFAIALFLNRIDVDVEFGGGRIEE